MPDRLFDRRDFVRTSLGTLGAIGAAASVSRAAPLLTPDKAPATPTRGPDTLYRGAQLDRIAFPLGGLGAGTICLEGGGGLTSVSVRNAPAVNHTPGIFAGLSVGGPVKIARVVEGPVPHWKSFGPPHAAAGTAPAGMGLPRFASATFRAHFPFGRVELEDPALPLTARITGWSPFEPGDADHASLPVAGLEYTFTHHGDEPVDAVFSFNCPNFMPPAQDHWGNGAEAARTARATPGGYILYGGAWAESKQEEAWFSAAVDEPDVKVNLAWFRGGWFDSITMAWRDVEQGAAYDRPFPTEGKAPTGATLFVPFHLKPGESRTIRVRLAWYAPKTHVRENLPAPAGPYNPADYYQPWYGQKFASIDAVTAYWAEHYLELRRRAERFSDCFFDSTLPPEVVEAVAANLSILKSPTVLRQADGRLWGWEGCDDDHAQGSGTCTHVWNYAQSVAHLFPALERTLRETEFGDGQNAAGHQNFRVAMPIQPSEHGFYAAADGQLGGIIKVHREWRISGDTAWLRTLWPKVKVSLDYCIKTWDPTHQGWPAEPQHNTYDIEFWGPSGMITSFYVGALASAVAMGRAVGDAVPLYAELLERGKAKINTELYNGEYYYQKVQWKGLQTKSVENKLSFGQGYSAEAKVLLDKEGPKYQYGTGCLSDGVLGAWLTQLAGVEPVLDPAKVRSHLKAVHRHNFVPDLSTHANPQRPTYALGNEAGLILCTWPRGGMPALPFVYSNEVWTGIEYQAAAHMVMMGLTAEGLDVVRGLRSRYDGRIRNPFDEYEWGHWYARAMASYALLEAFGGARFDALDGVLYLEPAFPGDYRCFLATATGYGTVGVTDGKPFVQVVGGTIPYKTIKYQPRPAA